MQAIKDKPPTPRSVSLPSHDSARPLNLDALRTMQREVGAGLAASIAVLPAALASGLLAYSPFGPAAGAQGAAAGLVGAAVGGFVAASTARSSFIVSIPRASSALLLAGLAVRFASDGGNGTAPGFFAIALCIFLAGLCQIAFGLFGVARLVRFTPHPVLAGFLNGVAILVTLGALAVLMCGAGTKFGIVCALAFAAVIAGLILCMEIRKSRIPGAIIGLSAGTALYYAFRVAVPDLPLGPTVGRLQIHLGGAYHAIPSGPALATLGASAPHILLTAVLVAVVASLESLLIARMARNLAPSPPEGARFLVAQGLGNAVAAAAGGITVSAAPATTVTGFRAGGRTRLVGMTAGAFLLILALAAPIALAVIPQVVLCAILFVNAYRVADSWSLRLVADALLRRVRRRRNGTWKDLAVIGAVTALTATTSVAVGVLTGVLLSCLIFIVGMSRPLVRRRGSGSELFSRRVRPARDVEILQRSGAARVVLELQGVMFFGNTDDLCTEIEALFKTADMVLLDLRHVIEIDVSAIGALEHAISAAAAQKKRLLFCNAATSSSVLFGAEGQPHPGVFRDRDTALEWMEETALHEAGRSQFSEIPLDQIELLQGLDPAEIETLSRYMTPMTLPAGEILCKERDGADCIWILSSGSVSILLGAAEGQPGRRIASVARGSLVGEMAFLAGGTRSATVRADEDVRGYRIDRDGFFEALLPQNPRIGATILVNIGREMAGRLRLTNQALGALTGAYD
jgi:sulfate permease, SulP family